ncbi:MAG: ZIP family metal transporter [Deltaproteobacteria bacterium]|nr:ZIP family metal transporter [Deltaproteobacteria bacterium]
MTLFWKNLGIYTGIIAAAIFIGGIIPLFKHWHREKLPVILSFAAGIMLGSAFFHLMPESYEILGKSVGLYVLAGFLFLYFIEKFITVHICEAFDCEIHHLKKWTILLVQLMVLSMIPLGAILAYGLIGPEHNLLIGKAIAFSAGTFLHISLSDLLPEVHKHSHVKHWTFLGLVAGLGLMWFLANHVMEHGV